MTSRPAAAFSAVQAGFERAKAVHPDGLSQSCVSLAGEIARLRVVGRDLSTHITRPWAHLIAPESTSEAPRLRIDLWDAEESRVPLPPGLASDRIGETGAVTSSRDGRFLVHETRYCITVLDRREERLVGSFEAGSRLPLEERARPLNLPLTVWCSDRDIQLVHSGLVARNGLGVLLPGLPEAGKSTAAVACAHAGFDFLGDDCVALRLSADGTFVGHSLYGSTTLARSQMARFSLISRAIRRRHTRSLAFLDQASSVQLIRAAPISLIALPRIVDSTDSRARPATKGDALLRLAPSSLLKRAVPAQHCLSRMATLVDRVPSFWLDLDGELLEIPRRVERLLAEAA